MWLAIPAYKLTCQFTIRKGKSWSDEERSVLSSIAKSASTLRTLTVQCPGSRPRVLASLDRMMRYGLVESSLSQGRLAYRATSKAAALLADRKPLPFFPKLTTRRISFLVERATHRSFASREVPLMPSAWLDELRRQGGDVRHVPVKRDLPDAPLSEEQLERLRALAVRARDELVVDAHVVDAPAREVGFMVLAVDSVVHFPRDAGVALRTLLAEASAAAGRRALAGKRR